MSKIIKNSKKKLQEIRDVLLSFLILNESPGQQLWMSHACMSEFIDIGRARRHE